MRGSATALLAVLVVGLVSPGAAATEAGPAGLDDPAELAAWLDERVRTDLEEHHIPGMTLSVVQGGQPVLAEGYGEADIARGEEVDPGRTLFNLGSVAKVVTWLAVLQGVDAGTFDPHSDVNDYLKGTALVIPDTYPAPVTLHHLATHTAGFEDVYDDVWVSDLSRRPSLDEYLVQHRPARVRPPGEVTGYSNYGANLAGFIVARSADVPFEEYVEERLFAPLGMRRSTFRIPVPDELSADLAVGYTRRDDGVQPQPPEIPSTAPSGALASNATDMAALLTVLLNRGQAADGQQVLPAGVVEPLLERQFIADERLRNGMTFGLQEARMHGHRVLVHGGASLDFATMLVLVPEHKAGVFVSVNTQALGPVRELVSDLLEGMLPVEGVETASPVEVDLTPYLGTYRSTRVVETGPLRLGSSLAFERRATPDGNGLRWGGETYLPVGDGVFETADGAERLVFQVDDGGAVTYLLADTNPREAYVRLAWYEDTMLALGLYGAALLVAFSWLLAAAFRGLRRTRHRTQPDGKASNLTIASDSAASGVAAAGGLLAIATAVLVGSVLLPALSDQRAFFIDGSSSIGGLQVVALLSVVLFGLTLVFAALAWRRGFWGLAGRIHYSLVALAGLVIVWSVVNWQFI